MRRVSLFTTILLALALALGAVACGSGGYGKAPGVGDPPEEILAAAFSSSYDMTSGTGGYSFEMTVDADQSQVPAEDAQFVQMLAEGISVSGTFAQSNDPMAVDCTLSLELMGQPLGAGLRVQEDGFWVSYADKWYEAPQEAMQEFEGYGSSQADPEEFQRLLEDLGLDPVTWFTDLTVIGEEEVAGVKTIHLTGSPDFMKMMSDVFELLKSQEFLTLIDPSGTITPGMLSSELPSPAEIQEVVTEVQSMFQGMTIDLWVSSDDSMVRKVAITGHMAPPPGEDAEGFLGMDISGSMWFDSINESVTIEAPESPLPFTELESAIMENPGPLQEFFEEMGGFGFEGPTIY